MQNKLFSVLLPLLFGVATTHIQAQQKRQLAPISGHYKQLAAFSAKPTPDSTDLYQFPIEGLPVSFMKRMVVKPNYLRLPMSEFRLPEFPANSSTQTKAEIDYLLKLQETARTPEKLKESLDFAGVYYSPSATTDSPNWKKLRQNLFHMGRQLGPWFSPDSLPVTANFMAKLWADGSYYFWSLKFKYNRTRPYMLDKRIKHLDDTNFQAYPSGHSSASWVAAFVYNEILPLHKNLFEKNAYDMAFSREILGVHFPSDSEAGRIFARQLVNYLLENEEFNQDLAKAKAEVLRVSARNK